MGWGEVGQEGGRVGISQARGQGLVHALQLRWPLLGLRCPVCHVSMCVCARVYVCARAHARVCLCLCISVFVSVSLSLSLSVSLSNSCWVFACTTSRRHCACDLTNKAPHANTHTILGRGPPTGFSDGRVKGWLLSRDSKRGDIGRTATAAGGRPHKVLGICEITRRRRSPASAGRIRGEMTAVPALPVSLGAAPASP